MRAIKDKILLKIVRAEHKFGSLFLPGEIQTATKEGIVCSVGDEVKSLKENDVVIFEPLSGVVVDRTDTYEIVSILERNVMAVK